MGEKFDEILEKQNDPELTEAVNHILLIFNLALLAEGLDKGRIKGKKVVEIAHRIAREQAAGDAELEDSVYRILIASQKE